MLLVGAGLSGIGAAYYLQTHCRTKSFTIVEAREEIGGTWDLFRYPGVSSDMYTFGYSFRLVHPGGAATSTVRNARVSKADPSEEELLGCEEFDRLLRLRPQILGESIVRGIERRRARMLVGSDAKIVSPIERTMPASYGPVLHCLRHQT